MQGLLLSTTLFKGSDPLLQLLQGPPNSVSEIESIFKAVQRQFPSAKIFGSTMDAFAATVTADDRSRMPLLTNEWGDQWLAGLQTDPWRIQVYREMARSVQSQPQSQRLGLC